jgi:hypothetical protein
MYGIENESSSLAKQKNYSKYSDYEYFDALSSSQNIQTMSIFTPCFMTTTDLLGARRSCGQLHHSCPQRNMLALFNSLKKSGTCANTVRPVTSWLFLYG